MFRFLSLMFLVLFLSCRPPSGIVDRLVDPYFPLHLGSTWVYQTPQGEEVNAKVVADSIIGQDTLRFYEFLGEVSLLYPRREVVTRWVTTEVYHLGTPWLLEARWQKILELPPVKGNTWTDRYVYQMVVQSDTLRVERWLQGRVGEPYPLQVPAGEYEVYPVDLREVRVVNTPVQRADSSWIHWDLAPGVGPVRILRWLWHNGGFQADTFELVAFQEGR